MRKVLIPIFALVAFSYILGCASPEEKLVKHMEKMASIVEDNKADPDKAADELTKYIADNKDDIKEIAKKLKEKEKGLKDDEKKKWEEEWGKKIMEPMKKVMKVAMSEKFAKSEKFQKAVKEFGDLIE